MASKAAGTINGVSKKSRLVVVKSSNSLLDVEMGFGLAYDDIMVKQRARRSVIVFPKVSKARYNYGDPFLPLEWRSIFSILRKTTDQRIPIVVPAGNLGSWSARVNTLPALWGTLKVQAIPLIIAGATTLVGDVAQFSQGHDEPDWTIWAPGVDIQCARRMSPARGTSCAAGLVYDSLRDNNIVYLLILQRRSQALPPISSLPVVRNQ